MPAQAGSGTFATLIPLAAAKESKAAGSVADTADWLADSLKLAARRLKSIPLTLELTPTPN